MHNEIFIHTNQGSYVGGEVIYGTVFLSIAHPVPARALMFEIVGYEKCAWTDYRTETYTHHGEQKTRQVEEKRHAHRDFFRDSVPLMQYPGGFPQGQFSYPFQYQLPADLPGVFYAQQHGHDKFKAKIQYKVKALLDIGHGKHLTNKQHLYVNERLETALAPKHVQKKKTVRTCCCFARGDVNCEAYLDKNAYMAGERANIHVDVNNESTVEMRHFNTKLIKHIRLRDDRGHHKQIRTVVTKANYPGCDPESKKATAVPLDLTSACRSSSSSDIQPSASSKYVSCEYQIQIELDIPWAPDLDIYVPIQIYAPQNDAWSAWQPPTWAAQAQQQQVSSDLAVDAAYLSAHLTNGYFHDPMTSASAPPSDFGASADYGASALPPNMQDSDPSRPLLG